MSPVMLNLPHLLTCPACGPLGRYRRRRARAAQEIADEGLAVFFERLGTQVRAARREERRLTLAAIFCGPWASHTAEIDEILSPLFTRSLTEAPQ